MAAHTGQILPSPWKCTAPPPACPAPPPAPSASSTCTPPSVACDACRLVATAEGASSERSAPGGKCPRCRRVYDSGTRFCAVDAEELVPLPLWQASHATEGGVHVDESETTGAGAARVPGGAVHFHGEGKICPVCAAKYDLEASFCGRDGSELVTVN
ncbi:MAG: hypothetical protein ACXVDD_05925 [Polyangia bacterium]